MLDYNFLKNLKHQCTRDLYWLLASEYPLNPNNTEFRLFPEVILNDIIAKHKDFIIELDQSPEDFENYLKVKPTRRLGIYAERLMAFFFESSPFINLLVHSFQIIREGETLGEIDFIIEWNSELFHLELAVKYYLGVGDLDLFQNWIGPSGNDSLALKLDKVLTKQLPLAKSAELDAIIDDREMQSYFFMKGKFFCNVGLERQPDWLNPTAKKGNYFRIVDSQQAIQLSTGHHLVRPSWLSDLAVANHVNYQVVDLEKLNAQVVKHGGVHLLQNENPVETHFIVKDTWPD